MERSLISWNLPNMFTVVIMAALGYAALGFVAQMLKGRQQSAGQAGG